MCTGIALAATELPTDVAEDPHLAHRLYVREGRKEMRFLAWQSPAILPVQWHGRLQIMPWGNRPRRQGGLPASGWVTREELDSGIFAHVPAEDALIPCHLGLHRGTWFLIQEGIRGIVAKAPRERDTPAAIGDDTSRKTTTKTVETTRRLRLIKD